MMINISLVQLNLLLNPGSVNGKPLELLIWIKSYLMMGTSVLSIWNVVCMI